VVLLAVAAVLLIKSLLVGATAWAAGATGAVAVHTGVALAQGGEFSLVILEQAGPDGSGILGESAFALAVAVVVLSLMITPSLLIAARWLAERAGRIRPAPWVRASALRGDGRETRLTEPIARPEPPPDQESSEPADAASPAGAPASTTRAKGSAIVAGFGPVGRAVADVLERRGIALTIIELNPRTVRRQSGLGRRMVYGDASNTEVLESAGLTEADAVILTMPDEEATLQACRVIRGLRPDIFIAARANVLSKALQAMQLGADHVVVEEMAAAEAMAAQVLHKIEQRAAGEDAGPRLYEHPPLKK
jgi:monovalent cation:H+ antiporter-2, CPA2 family